ncbi:MAG: efflux transporter outer membrane subunit [Phycisphaerales bacterium]|nr:MAG: efflux transporter outer membrane subunit [Phycisphaerales bacterium]
MSLVKRWGLVVSLGAGLLISGCMIGPGYERPETVAEMAPRFVHSESRALDVDEVIERDRWWERFGDPVTADLVREALENNYDLQAMAARVLQAQASLAEARGRLWPEVSYDLTRTRGKTYIDLGDFGEMAGGGGGGGFSFITTTWSQNVSISYLVDFWGKLRRARRGAWADMLVAEASRQALVNSVVATVIQARVDIATAQRRLAIARANTESRQRTYDITERRYRGGLVGPVEVRLARANLEQARAQEPGVELTLAMTRSALDVLLGRRPGASENLPETLPDLPDLTPIPVGVPAALLDRRPDVKAAEFSLWAANERVGASLAQLYPDLTLTGSYGASSSEWENIWNREFEVYSAITNLAAPIWKGGQIRAQIRAAKARYEELASEYVGTVLKAMQEVEDALAGEKLLLVQVEHRKLQFEESEAAEELSRRRYERGVESLLTVLEAERNRRIAEEQLTILRSQIWATRISLHLALGGDWAGPTEEQVVRE